MDNALLQSSTKNAHHIRKHKGEGPSLIKLMERVASRTTPNPPQVACIVQEAVVGTLMYKESRPLHGDKETIQHKRFRAFEMDKCSHKPRFVMENRHHRSKQPIARRVQFEGENLAANQENPAKMEQEKTVLEEGQQGSTKVGGGHQHRSPSSNDEFCKENIGDQNTRVATKLKVREDSVAETMWAVRHTPLDSKVKCLGIIDGKNKCNSYLQGSSTRIVAPSFYSKRRHPGPGGPKAQMMWFCPYDVSHT